MSRETYYRLDFEEIKKIINSLTKEESHPILFQVYQQFISSELPKISTDIEIEGEGNNFLIRTVVDGIINTINTYPHPEKDKMIYISVNGSEKSVIKVKNVLERLVTDSQRKI